MTRAASRPAGAGGIKSVAKVLDILECLVGAGRPVGASGVARAVGFHVGTIRRLPRDALGDTVHLGIFRNGDVMGVASADACAWTVSGRD